MFNLKNVCSTANVLHSAGYSRSQAFIFAWAMEKGTAVKVRGVSKENRQKALCHLLRYDPQDISIRLQREPENLFDHNAIVVIAAVRGRGAYKAGYLPCSVAAVLAPLMDAGKVIQSKYKEVKGGYLPGMSYGLTIKVKM